MSERIPPAPPMAHKGFSKKWKIVIAVLIGAIVIIAIIIGNSLLGIVPSTVRVRATSVNSVTLNSPSNNGGTNALTINFTYTPIFYQDIQNVTLYTNVSGWIATQGNTTAVLNNTVNGISYTFSSDGICIWNVGVYNSTTQLFASSSYAVSLLNVSYSQISASTTVAGVSCTFSALWQDTINVSGYIFGTNNTNTGQWSNGTGWTSTWSNWPTTISAWANVTEILNSTVGLSIGYEWWCNDTNNVWGSTEIQSLTTVTPYPTWQNQGENSTSIAPSGTVSLYAQGSANSGLSYAWLWTNETGGVGQNYTSPNVASFTKYPYNPIMSATQSWEGEIMGEQSTLYVNGVFDIWYRAGATASNYAIGFANSTNGITWTKYGGNPVLTISGGVKFPNVILIGSTFYLYAVEGANNHLFRWESSNGLSWTIDNSGNPVLSHSNTGWDALLANNVIYYNASASPAWNMIYEGVNSSADSDEIGYAYSSDGLSWTKYSGNPVYTGQFRILKYAANPSRPVLVNSAYYMWIAQEFSNTTIYLDVIYSSNFETWTVLNGTTITPTLTSDGTMLSNPQVLDLTGQGLTHDTYMIYSSNQNTFSLVYMDVSVSNYISNTNAVYTTTYGSPLSLGNVANTWTWSDFIWTNGAITSGTIQWKIYYNDTLGNVNCTGILSFTIGVGVASSYFSNATLKSSSSSTTGSERAFSSNPTSTVSAIVSPNIIDCLRYTPTGLQSTGPWNTSPNAKIKRDARATHRPHR